MSTVKVKVSAVITFRGNAQLYKQINGGKKNALTWALDRMLKRTEDIQEDYNEDVNDARFELAGKDKEGFIIEESTENGGAKYKYTPENRKKLSEKIKELQAKEVEVEPYIATSVPDDLPFDFRDVFTPFVLEELSEKELEELYLKQSK